MSQPRSEDLSTDSMKVIGRERAYWEQYQDLDWSSDESKLAAFQNIPRLEGDVLELCIGAGTFTKALPKTYDSITGVDISQTLLRALEERLPCVSAVHGDAQRLDFEDESFDTVLIFSGLHHLPKYRRSITDAYRVLRPGGFFYCFEPNDRAWYRAPMRLLRRSKLMLRIIGIYSEDEVFLDPRIVARDMEDAGFTDLEVGYLTPRFRPGYLSVHNSAFAQAIYAASSLGRAARTQSYFTLTGRKP